MVARILECFFFITFLILTPKRGLTRLPLKTTLHISALGILYEISRVRVEQLELFYIGRWDFCHSFANRLKSKDGAQKSFSLYFVSVLIC